MRVLFCILLSDRDFFSSYQPLLFTSALTASAVMCVFFLCSKISSAFLGLVDLLTLHRFVKVYQMSVKFRTVYAGKFHFAAYSNTAGMPHMPVESTMIGFKETIVGIFSASVVLQTNFIMIIGPIATQRS